MIVFAIIYATLGAVGAAYILVSYIYFPAARKPSNTLVCQLAIFDLFGSLGILLRSISFRDELCTLQAFILAYSNLGSVLTSTVIANFLYDVIVTRKHPSSEQMYRNYVIVNAICLVISCLPFTTDSYGDTGSWCWVTESNRSIDEGLFETAGVWWRLLCFYFILWTVVPYNLYIYLQLSRIVSKADDAHFGVTNSKEATLKLVHSLISYPIYIAVLYAPASALRLADIFNKNGAPEWLEHLALCYLLLGLCNAFTYGYAVMPLWRNEVVSWGLRNPKLASLCCCIDIEMERSRRSTQQPMDLEATVLSSVINPTNISIDSTTPSSIDPAVFSDTDAVGGEEIPNLGTVMC